jgi:hypothetical protein
MIWSAALKRLSGRQLRRGSLPAFPSTGRAGKGQVARVARLFRVRLAHRSSPKPITITTMPRTAYWPWPLIPDPCIAPVPCATHIAPTTHKKPPMIPRIHMSDSDPGRELPPPSDTNEAARGINREDRVIPAHGRRRPRIRRGVLRSSVLDDLNRLDFVQESPEVLRKGAGQPVSRRSLSRIVSRAGRSTSALGSVLGRRRPAFGRRSLSQGAEEMPAPRPWVEC